MCKRYALFLITISFIFSVPTASFLYADTTDVTITIIEPLQCYDGEDNDSDGLTDYPNDPGCEASGDDDETDPISCGDGTCNGSESCSSCSADCGACPSSGGGGGGGGGTPIAPVISSITSALFKGRAYPNSSITVLKDAQVAATTITGSDADFQVTVGELTGGNYVFSLYSEDKDGRRSSLQTFPLSVTKGASTQVTGIFIAPTIDVDKSEVKRGDDIVILGQGAPQADIVISVNSEEEFFAKTISDKDGVYFYNFDTSVLEYGSHKAKSKASIGNQLVSGFSYPVNFKVGTKNVAKETLATAGVNGDSNNDNKVNLIDFSITAFWYKRPSPPATVDLNTDGKVDLVDFSIMAFYWTG